MKLNLKAAILILVFISLGLQAIANPEGGVSRRSFLAMLGGALGAAAMGPTVTVLAEKVVATRINEAQRLMQIRSSLDIEFIRRSAWERYLTGKVTVNPIGMGNDLTSLHGYRAKLAEFITNPSISPESKELAQMLFRETNNWYPFDISPQEYAEKAKEYFQRARAETLDLRSEEVVQRVQDSFDRVYEEARVDYENGEVEREIRIAICRQYLM